MDYIKGFLSIKEQKLNKKRKRRSTAYHVFALYFSPFSDNFSRILFPKNRENISGISISRKNRNTRKFVITQITQDINETHDSFPGSPNLGNSLSMVVGVVDKGNIFILGMLLSPDD